MVQQSKSKRVTSGDWLWGSILVLAVFVAYQPVWYAGFIWDDDSHLTANRCIVGPLGLKEVWTTAAANYFPLTLTSWWVMHALWGLNPLAYHLVNVATHAACTILLWRVLLGLRVPGAWLGAALWALHPVQVESVAWVSEFINGQSCLFYLLTILLYTRWRESAPTGKGNGKLYGLALMCALAAVLSKPSTVMLPVVLALISWWLDGKLKWRNVVELAPFFVISTMVSAWAIWEQKYHSGALGEEWAQTWPERIVIAGRDVWFYLGKLAWPDPLIFIYPRWEVEASYMSDFLPVLALAGALFALGWFRAGTMRPVFFVMVYFVVSLFPVLDFFNVYYFRYAFVADHFQYLASMGPLALAGAGLARLADIVIAERVWLRGALCAGLLLLLGTLSWQRAWAYESEETLWNVTLAQDPNCWMAHDNLGKILAKKGQLNDAMVQYEAALAIDPNLAEIHYNIGTTLFQKGQLDGAMAEYQKALEINSGYAEAHNNLGLALFQKGQLDKAMAEYQRAIELKPDYEVAHYNLGQALLQKWQFEEAISKVVKEYGIKLNQAGVPNNLGQGGQKWQLDEAIFEFQKALEMNPRDALAFNDLGLALLQEGQLDEAISQLQKAVDINPGFARAHFNLGLAFVENGQLEEAIVHYQEALVIDPNIAQAHDALGKILLQKGQLGDAIEQFQEALRIAHNYPDAQDDLAKALAITKKYPDLLKEPQPGK